MLAQRALFPGEMCTQLIEEIIKLCKVVSACMTEEDNVGHLLKGFDEDIYNFLTGKESLEPVSNVIKHCCMFEQLKMHRITPKFGCLAGMTTVAAADEAPSCNLVSTIRQIIREELTSSLDNFWSPSMLPPTNSLHLPQTAAVNAAGNEEYHEPQKDPSRSPSPTIPPSTNNL